MKNKLSCGREIGNDKDEKDILGQDADNKDNVEDECGKGGNITEGVEEGGVMYREEGKGEYAEWRNAFVIETIIHIEADWL